MSNPNGYKHYSGDVNLEHGGFFANLDDWHSGYADVLRVTDLDSACGFDGAVMIERLAVIIPTNIKEAKRIYSSCGWENGLPGDTSESRKMAIIDACLSYGAYDPHDGWDNYHTGYLLIVQTESDPDFGPMKFDGWMADVRLGEGDDLLDHLEKNGYMHDFD
jgi:hypothetical protein